MQRGELSYAKVRALTRVAGLKTESNVVVLTLDDGAIRFVKPDGAAFDSTLPDHTQPLREWYQLVETHEQQDLDIDHRTAATRWDGGPCDHGFAVESLLNRWRGRLATGEEILMHCR